MPHSVEANKSPPICPMFGLEGSDVGSLGRTSPMIGAVRARRKKGLRIMVFSLEHRQVAHNRSRRTPLSTRQSPAESTSCDLFGSKGPTICSPHGPESTSTGLTSRNLDQRRKKAEPAVAADPARRNLISSRRKALEKRCPATACRSRALRFRKTARSVRAWQRLRLIMVWGMTLSRGSSMSSWVHS